MIRSATTSSFVHGQLDGDVWHLLPALARLVDVVFMLEIQVNQDVSVQAIERRHAEDPNVDRYERGIEDLLKHCDSIHTHDKHAQVTGASQATRGKCAMVRSVAATPKLSNPFRQPNAGKVRERFGDCKRITKLLSNRAVTNSRVPDRSYTEFADPKRLHQTELFGMGQTSFRAV
jgi:hypothetical protein